VLRVTNDQIERDLRSVLGLIRAACGHSE
jgi:hypothetical protein